ncbi:CapA family protein [uncultured Winogradskyella sp.]|uniref:CapA family protein n=1 Tax=uncultured Winogradskyella sp. TaxID=395353 RepID=UPI002639C58B|nr:CapA family protein [uncultured Winogradskyella sp.]
MVKIIIGGDICATKRDENAFLEGDASLLFDDMLPEIKAADLAIANLETPLISESTPIKKSGAVFGNSPKMLNAIKRSGISFLNLANNHILDHGQKGLKNTLEALKSLEFSYSGAGESLEAASEPFSTTIKGKRISILSYTEHEFSIAEHGKSGANPVDVIDFVTKIKTLKETNDFIILLYHGGKENYHLPSPKQQKLCRFYIDQGVNMVVCQHSHSAGVYEKYNNGSIFYGQGNFVFDPYPLKKDWLYKGFLIEVLLHDDNSTAFKFIPYIHKSFYKDEIGIRKMSKEESQPFLDYINKESQKMIKNPRYIQEEWIKLSKSLENTYFSILNGNGRLMRKLNEKSSWLKSIYKNDRKLVLKNIVTCETHREIVETILKNK